jgi:hypothetical protein
MRRNQTLCFGEVHRFLDGLFDGDLHAKRIVSLTNATLGVIKTGRQAPHAHVLGANGEELALLIERLKARCAASGHPITRVILTHEAGRDGFWLARFLVRRDVEVHVMQPSGLPVDRRARRAKTDVIDVEMVLRTSMAWLRGEPRVCSRFQFRMKPMKKRAGLIANART